jgi:hypothetical protein
MRIFAAQDVNLYFCGAFKPDANPTGKTKFIFSGTILTRGRGLQ